MHEPARTSDAVPAPPAGLPAVVGVHVDDRAEVHGLVERARTGDRAAFRELYDRYSRRIWAYARSRVSSVEDAEDITAETFLAAWRAIGRYTWTGAPFSGWLVGIATLQVRQLHRTKSRRPTTSLDDAGVVPAASQAAGDHAEATVTRHEAHRLLRLLPEEQQAVLAMRFWGGLSAEEIGTRTGRSAGSVRQLQLRALERLSFELRKERAA